MTHPPPAAPGPGAAQAGTLARLWHERRTRRPGELTFALLFLAFALFLWSHLGEQARWLRRLQWFQQPALWPAIGIWGMLGFGLAYLAQVLFARPSEKERTEVFAWLRALEFVGWYMAYAWSVGWLGYLPATVLAMVLLVWRLGIATRTSLIAAVAFAIGVVLLFKSFFRVGIPGGRLYALFPPETRLFLSIWF
jgi:hypothetical protein